MERETKAEIAVYRKVMLRMVPFLFMCYAFNFLDRVNISYAKLQMSSALNFSETHYGLGAGIFFIGYLLFQIPSNRLLVRLGAKTWLSCIMIAWGLISISTLFVTTPREFYVVRFLLGVAEAGFFPGVLFYFTQWYPNERLGRIIAMLLLGFSAAGILGAPISGWIMQQSGGLGTMQNWQWLFLLEGFPTIILGCLLPFILPTDIQSTPWLNSQEKEILTYRLKSPATDGNVQPVSLLDLFKDARMWQLMLLYFFLFNATLGTVFFFPTFIKKAGVTNFLHIGLLSSIPYIASMVASVAFAYTSDIFKERRWHLLLLALAGAIGLLGTAAFAHNLPLLVTSISIAVAAFISSGVVFWTIPPLYLTTQARATGIALISSAGSLGGFFAPYMIGYLTDLTHSFTAPLLALALMVIVASIFAYFIPKNLNPLRGPPV